MSSAVEPRTGLPEPSDDPLHRPDDHDDPDDLPAVEAEILSFEDLFREQYEGMIRVAFLLVGSRTEAEDVVQDAFARVNMRWKRIANPRAYLHRCVVNRSHDLLRRRRVEQRFWWLQRSETSELGADELGDALATLPAERRTAVVLRYYAGFSEKQIAEAMGVRPGTVKSMLHRAMAELKRVIDR
jgi:RNA polymerase sigma-70 factor (sigma-E family)